ncbi:MAG: DUF3795 domain-containing protein, partial [Prolixibacteraceae bacterium]|nr:DUF3795 domain-containing protein [Prolixibacteraceae bacterium]
TITAETINCMDCRTDGQKIVFCNDMSEIRKCVYEKGFNICGNCGEMDACSKVGAVFQHVPDAKENFLS